MSHPIVDAQTLEAEGKLAEAIQVYDSILNTTDDTSILATANFRLGAIYWAWRELFTAQRFLVKAHQLSPKDSEIRDAIEELNLHFSENREAITEEISRKNSDQIVSLFRIATGIKLITMDKTVQAYPLLKSRTKLFPNAAVAKHLLTDIQITESERNSAIDFLLEREWLVSTGVSLYTIAESGLFAFYTELAQLHTATAAYAEAVSCYEQAYWLDPSQHYLRYQQVICHAEAEAWDAAVGLLAELPTEVPESVDPVGYYTAVAQSYHQVYQTTQDEQAKQGVIDACERVLRLDKKSSGISKLLASYQGKKRWWRR